MKNYNYKRILMLIMLLFPILTFAQTTGQKIENAGKQVNEAVDTYNTLKGLFGKKKKAGEAGTSVEPSGATKQNAIASATFAGKISPKVKYIDCDKLNPFNYGAAIVEKGNAVGLIDSSGNFIIPYHRYSSLYEGSNDYLTSLGGILAAQTDYNNGNLSHYINTKGKVIWDRSGNNNAQLSGDGKFVVVLKEQGNLTVVTLVDYNGKQSSLTVPGKVVKNNYGTLTGVRDSVITFYSQVGNKLLYGFKNFRGKGIPVSYNDISEFIDGVATFTVVDNFGNSRYGLINKEGIIIAPAQFTNKPSPYRYGHTLVKASKDADFQSAFIDTKGNIIFKQTLETQDKYGFFHNFLGDFCSSGKYLLHKSGKVLAAADFFNVFNFDYNRFQYPEISDSPYRFNDRNIRFTFRKKDNALIIYHGIYNIDAKQALLFDPVDGHISYNLYHLDPVSKLMYAKLKSSQKDKYGTPIVLEGYININGEFVLMKGAKKSDW